MDSDISLLAMQEGVQVVFLGSNKKLCISQLFLHLLAFIVNVVKINMELYLLS